MKVLILCALVAVSQAAVLLNPGIIGMGGSTQYRSQDGIGNYAFGYKEAGGSGGTFRSESGDAAGNKIGSYGLTVADGRRRVVSYVADGLGFRAKIDTNEPGVDPSKDPAATLINKGAIGASLLAAPALAVPGLAAPALAAAPLMGRTIVTAPGYTYSF